MPHAARCRRLAPVHPLRVDVMGLSIALAHTWLGQTFPASRVHAILAALLVNLACGMRA